MSIFVDVLVELISTDKYSNCQLNQYIYKYCCLGIVNSKVTWKLYDIIHEQIIRDIFTERFDVLLIKHSPGRRRLQAPRKLILLHPWKKNQNVISLLCTFDYQNDIVFREWLCPLQTYKQILNLSAKNLTGAKGSIVAKKCNQILFMLAQCTQIRSQI